MTRPLLLGPTLLALLSGLAGCGNLDPYQKPYAWHPTGANQANIAAMVANPRDLQRGRGATLTDAAPAVLAIERVRADQPKALTDGGSGGATGGGATGGATTGGGATGGAAGGGSGGG